MRLNHPLNPVFETDARALSAKYALAEEKIKANLLRAFPVEDTQYTLPILIEGAYYTGAWLECAPLEGLVYGRLFDFDVARGNHQLFFDWQFDDGQIPCWFIRGQRGRGQIQMVVPIAKTAWELYQLTGWSDFLEQAYAACSRWDDWLTQHRDRARVDLVELFCVYDTGHDNSTRFSAFCPDLPHECPAANELLKTPAMGKGDAKALKPIPGLPWYAPDLSATSFGGRVALAEMARELGRNTDAERWHHKAEATRNAIMTLLYDPDTACFYDRTADGTFNRILSDSLSRVLCEHVVKQSQFDEIFRRHIANPDEFWPPYPLPSVAVSDPNYKFAKVNNWGGPTQALTALRASRWFEHYGRPAELTHMMGRWIDALLRAPDFPQQLEPMTGECSPEGGYAPCILVLFDYVSRLHGICLHGDELHWNCALPANATRCEYRIRLPAGEARLVTTREGSTLQLGKRTIARAQGTCRIVTDLHGVPDGIIGTALTPQRVSVTLTTAPVHIEIGPNQVMAFA